MRSRTIFAPFAIAAGAAVLAAGADAVVPGTNGRIFYASNASGSYNIWSVAPDGTGATQLTTQPNNSTAAERPSVDGNGGKVAYMQFDDVQQANSSQIWIMNGDGTGQTQLTHTGNNFLNVEPGISPDGSKIVFAGVDTSGSGTTGFDLYEMNADGSGLVQLSNTTEEDKSPEFSPDGTKIVFVRATGTNQIWLMNADGTNQHVLLNDPGQQDRGPSWSPDGTKIVYANDASGLMVMNANGTNPHQLLNGSGQAIHGQDPTWSPDGTKIAFYYVPGGAGSEGIFTIPAAGGSDPQQLINLGTDFQSVYPSWAAAGTQGSAPDTTITKSTVSSRRRRASFLFTAVGASTGFECALVSKAHPQPSFASCAPPKTYRHLRPGRYTFEVRAVNGSTKDATPATKRFSIRR